MNDGNQTIKGVLLDMDGTLVDHMSVLHRCFAFAAETLGHAPPNFETVKRSIGGSMPVTIRKFVPEPQAEKAIELWKSHFEEIYLEDVTLLPGARELLRTLKAAGIQSGIFTNKIGKHTRRICDTLELTPLIDFALGAEDTEYRKPQKEFSEYALSKIGLPPENVVMVGDSPFDIEAADQVGMRCFAVPTGSHTIDELRDSGADRLFSGLDEIAREVFGYAN